MTIGERIRIVRKDMKLTQEEFGNKIGMSRSMVVNLEMEKLKNEDQVRRSCRTIATICNVNEEWLLNGEGEMYAPVSKEKELADMAYSIMHEEDDFRKKLVETMLKLDEKQLEFLRDMANSLADEK